MAKGLWYHSPYMFTGALDPFPTALMKSNSSAISPLITTAAADTGPPSLLILLDLSTAFDAVDHDVLLNQLQTIGLTDAAYTWFWSYLTDRTEYISIRNVKSHSHCDLQSPSGVSRWSTPLHLIHALPWPCHLSLWNLISLQCWWHTTLHENGPNFITVIIINNFYRHSPPVWRR